MDRTDAWRERSFFFLRLTETARRNCTDGSSSSASASNCRDGWSYLVTRTEEERLRGADADVEVAVVVLYKEGRWGTRLRERRMVVLLVDRGVVGEDGDGDGDDGETARLGICSESTKTGGDKAMGGGDECWFFCS